MKAIPSQKYDIIEISKLGIYNSIGMICDDCGRSISNTATIRGREYDDTYTIGLTCLKKLLKENESFISESDNIKIQVIEYEFDSIILELKKVQKVINKLIKNKEHYNLEISVNDTWIYLLLNGDCVASSTKEYTHKLIQSFYVKNQSI